MTYLILVNALKVNRGSEAVVRGMVSIIKNIHPEAYIIVGATGYNLEKEIFIEGVNEYVPNQIWRYKYGLCHFIYKFLQVINNKTAEKFKYLKILKKLKKVDTVIIGGADNYDAQYGMQESMCARNDCIFEKYNKKIIMLDVSLEIDHITDTVKKDFKRFDVVTVRDKISQKALWDSGIRNIIYHPDPAFKMKKEECKLPFCDDDNVIGINISNLICQTYNCQPDVIYDAYIYMIKQIIKNTEYKILLIPHVMENADLSVLRKLYKSVNSDRVLLLENEKLNAQQLKYIISKCYMLITARTHASIAAYSSLVPTIVVGYSVKSRGIAQDIFTEYEHFVIDINELKNISILYEAFIYMEDNRDLVIQKEKDFMNKIENQYDDLKEILR